VARQRAGRIRPTGRCQRPKFLRRATVPVVRIACYLKMGKYVEHIGGGAPVYLFVVLEYLTVE